jgi:RimJ/RimL family protein N-acetyltransferase
MITPTPTVLEGYGVRLEPLTRDHESGLALAASDGSLWELWYTFVPAPDETASYVAAALDGQSAGHMLPWAVRELAGGAIVGSTRYHDIVPTAHRVEIGATWYAASWQRSHINTSCKLLLLEHAFDALACQVVGFRTDSFNFASQRSIAALGAQRDGVIRRYQARRDASVRDSVMFSILREEWPHVKRHLMFRLARHRTSSVSEPG